ncbi:unnamed protein product [Triticum turgidum subsp. durum]|uniref:Amino acid transporter transmembrane domain-containing protein n=1 Tax=Triticum turgidum subsp. durum TaxID=4567 RepID=A0A9R0V2A1_TRITD|nr:unnamed protein product [Triticum turgidum subsp. durum]
MGYAALGENTPRNLLAGFGFYEPFWLLDIAHAAHVIHLIGSYRVDCQTLFVLVENWAERRWPKSSFVTDKINIKLASYSLKFNLFGLTWRSLFVVLTTLVSTLLPFSAEVAGFVTAMLFWPLTVYFPIQMFIVQKKIPKHSIQWACLQLLSLAWLIITITAAASYIVVIVRS